MSERAQVLHKASTEASWLVHRASAFKAKLDEMEREAVKLAPKLIDQLYETGLSLRQIARRMGRSVSYVSRVRNGQVSVSLESFEKLKDVLEFEFSRCVKAAHMESSEEG